MIKGDLERGSDEALIEAAKIIKNMWRNKFLWNDDGVTDEYIMNSKYLPFVLKREYEKVNPENKERWLTVWIENQSPPTPRADFGPEETFETHKRLVQDGRRFLNEVTLEERTFTEMWDTVDAIRNPVGAQMWERYHEWITLVRKNNVSGGWGFSSVPGPPQIQTFFLERALKENPPQQQKPPPPPKWALMEAEKRTGS